MAHRAHLLRRHLMVAVSLAASASCSGSRTTEVSPAQMQTLRPVNQIRTVKNIGELENPTDRSEPLRAADGLVVANLQSERWDAMSALIQLDETKQVYTLNPLSGASSVWTYIYKNSRADACLAVRVSSAGVVDAATWPVPSEELAGIPEIPGWDADEERIRTGKDLGEKGMRNLFLKLANVDSAAADDTVWIYESSHVSGLEKPSRRLFSAKSGAQLDGPREAGALARLSKRPTLSW